MPIQFESKEDLLSIIQGQANKLDEMQTVIDSLKGNDNSNDDDDNDDNNNNENTSDLDFLFN